MTTGGGKKAPQNTPQLSLAKLSVLSIYIVVLDLGYNPWEVSDATAFLKYCCPECDFKNELYEEFSGHALENHVLATTLFVKADRLECPRLWRITLNY